MNSSYVKYIAEKLSFPNEAVDSLLSCAEKVTNSRQADVLMMDALSTFERTDYSFEGMKDRFVSISRAADISKSSAEMLMLLLACEKLEKKYADAGYGDKFFVDTMSDLKYKLVECHGLYGVWGTDSEWHPDFYRMKRFALGRFQYEKREFRGEFFGVNGNFIRKGDTVLNFHIPSSGVGITKDVRYDSYRRAREFFYPDSDKPTAFVCSSYLLWPDYEKCFPENTNVFSFRHDFTIVSTTEYTRFTNAWRVFGAAAWSDVSEWPRDTSQRRLLAEYTERGGKHGSGYGVFFFDGEKIVK